MKKDRRIKVTVNVSELGRRGGKARAAKMSPAKRKAAARKAVNVRWKRYREAHNGGKGTA